MKITNLKAILAIFLLSSQFPALAGSHNYSGASLQNSPPQSQADRVYRVIPNSPAEKVSPAVARHIERGNQLVIERRYDEAIKEYEEAIEKSKTPVFSPHFNMGYALRQKGEFDLAIQAYSQAIANRPEDFRGHFGLAEAHYEKGDFAAAEASYRKAIELTPGQANARAYHFLGLSLFAQERFEDAIKAYRLAIAHSGNNYAEARYNLGIALMKVEQWQVADTEFRIAIQQERKPWPEAHFNLAIVLESQKKFEEAAKEFETYLRLSPKAEDAERIRKRIETLREKKE